MLLQIKQQTPEWHKFRSQHIGASEAPIIAEVSPYKTPYELWLEKLGLIENQVASPAMQRGLNLEPKVRESVEIELGMKFEPILGVSDEFNFMAASLDGYNRENKTAIEIKCPGSIDHEIAENRGIPIKYFPQLQHQMIVLGIDKIYYCSYRTDLVIVEVKRDESYCQDLIKKEFKFWSNVKNLEAPRLTEKDCVSRDDYEWKIAVEEFLIYQKKSKEFKNKEKEIRSLLEDLSEGRNCEGYGVKMFKVARKGNIDYQSIPELENINLDQYRKPSSWYWKITT